MRLNDYLQQSYLNFKASKLRSFLAMLGIIVGTVAVVALLSCGQLATDKALAEFKTLGTDLLSINISQDHQGKSVTYSPMSLSNWAQIAKQSASIQKIAPYTSTYQKVSYQGHALDGMIIGADERLSDVIHIELSRGYFVSFVDSFEHFCVIGDELVQKIQQKNLKDPLYQQIQIGTNIYTIIGIASRWKENAFFNYDINNAVITPLGGIGIFDGNRAINNAIISLYPNTPIDTVISEVKEHIQQFAPKQMIFIRSAKQMISSMEKQGQIFTLLLTVIGSISLLVGGIGIMNVMLVSVSERKKEIGIRKAIGAKASEIQNLFLLESVVLTLSGGLLGIFLGEILTWIIADFSGWTFTFYLTPPLAGFTVSAVSGIFFGYYPAKRASKLEPIISLRGE